MEALQFYCIIHLTTIHIALIFNKISRLTVLVTDYQSGYLYYRMSQQRHDVGHHLLQTSDIIR